MAEGYLRGPPFGNGLTPSSRMLPSVIGVPGFSVMAIVVVAENVHADR